MKSSKVQRTTKDERYDNEVLLKYFKLTFCARDQFDQGFLFHDDGTFFGKMNKTKVEAYLYSIFNDPCELLCMNHISIRKGISMDYLPGEIVLEFHCYPHKISLGEEDEYEGEKRIYRYAFTFKDFQIYTIRIPEVVIQNLSYFESNN